MNSGVTEYEPTQTLFGPPTKEQAQHEDQLDADLQEALSAEVPKEIEDDINQTLLETELTTESYGEESHDTKEQVAPEDGNEAEEEEEKTHEWVCREFSSLDSPDSSVKILIRESATIGDNFQTSVECLIGRKAVVGNNCKSASPILKKVKLGNGTILSEACQIGARKPKLNKDEQYQVQIGNNVFVNRGVKIKTRTVVGDNSFIAPWVTIGENSGKKKTSELTSIGDNCVLNESSMINNGASIGDGCWVGEEVTVESGASVGNDCWLQDGVLVRQGAVIGNGYIIESGTNVPKKTRLPDNDTGTPILIGQSQIYKYSSRV